MKRWLIGMSLVAAIVPAANASQVELCQADHQAKACTAYLEGVVDGALMYKPRAVGARLESDDYSSRALKFRGGKRYQEANRQYCLDRLPDRDNLVLALVEGFESGNIGNAEELQEGVFALLNCQRMN